MDENKSKRSQFFDNALRGSALLGAIISLVPRIFIEKQQAGDFVLDIMIVCIFLALTIAFSYLAARRKNRILYIMAAIFTFCHFIAFPMIYTYLLNSNPNNLRIEKDILDSEKSNQYTLIKETYGESNVRKQQILNDLLINEMPFAAVIPDSIKDYQMFILKKYIVVSNFKLEHRGNHPPEVVKSLNIYNKNGNLLLILDNEHDFPKVSSLLQNSIEDYKNIESKKNKAIGDLNVNKFWSYKSVLPYSINIFITSNLVPKSKIANAIYFIHNFFIFTFLLSFIVGIAQTLYSKNEN